ncbi:MAG: amidase [Rhodospirillales bacterium]|nr:amidase [Rhodospirillales bacterium]
MTNPDPAMMSATDLVHLFRTKALSPVEATAAAFRRIHAHDKAVNAFCLVDEASALRAAKESEARWMKGAPMGLVDGVPTTIKDVVLGKGWPTLRGSRAISPDQPWTEDAPAVARLREAGAVFLGKTTTPEFGWKAVTDSPLTGITRNPWNTARTTGGSSGGAAAATALGMGPLHIGTDGGGSVRIPAGFTGVFGLKPSFGRVPVWPASPYGTLSHLGPMTRTVADAALMLNVIAAPDVRDWTSLPFEARNYRDGLEDGVKGLRIAFSPDLGYVKVDPEIARGVGAAAKLFEDLGARVEEVNPGFANPFDAFLVHWRAGAAYLLSQFDANQRALMDPGLQENAAAGEQIGLMNYMAAAIERARLGQHVRQFHTTYDLLLTPTTPLAAFAAGQDVPRPAMKVWVEWASFSYPFNLTQQPACSVPCGFTQDGLPIGLQIVGPMHADALVLRAARAFETAKPFRMPDAPRAPSGAGKS